jgi:hypothetical protein
MSLRASGSALRTEGATRNEAVERLHALLRRAARFEAARRRTVKLRKCAWQGRELPVEPEAWNLFSSVTFVSDAASSREMLSVKYRRQLPML